MISKCNVALEQSKADQIKNIILEEVHATKDLVWMQLAVTFAVVVLLLGIKLLDRRVKVVVDSRNSWGHNGVPRTLLVMENCTFRVQEPHGPADS